MRKLFSSLEIGLMLCLGLSVFALMAPAPTIAGILQAIIPAAVPTANKIGNSSKFQLGTGSPTSGHCVSYDANGNVQDAGAVCGTGTSNGANRPYLNFQTIQGPVGPTGTIFTYTLPANTMGSTGCIRVTFSFRSTTNAGSPIINFVFGSTTIPLTNQGATGRSSTLELEMCNTGTLSSQWLTPLWLIQDNGTAVGFGIQSALAATEDTTTPLTVAFTTSGGTGGNSVTPASFKVW